MNGLDPRLAELNGLALLDAPPWTPQTIGWAALGTVVLLVVLWLVIGRIRSWQRNAYRRLALAELSAIEAAIGHGDDPATAAAEIPVLLKRVVLAAWPRERVAALSGTGWLEFLDAALGGDDFSCGDGAILLQLSYRRQTEIPEERLGALVGLARRFIEKHHV